VLAHLLVALTAAVVTAVTVPLVARMARRAGVVQRRAEAGGRTGAAVPTLGGLGMLAGFLVAMGVAWYHPAFAPLFTATSEPLALLVGVVVIVAVGLADDLIDLPPTVKLAGQVLAALGVAVLGIQLVYFWVPGIEIVALSGDLSLPLTVLALVAMVNAMNLIDGLDGLAAGVAAIAATAFFVFAVVSEPGGPAGSIPSSATLIAAIVVGISLGFLVHNWHPASIFMGDTGSLLLGLLLGAAGVSYVGRTTAPTSVDFFGSIPLLVPALVLAIPFLDAAFAVVRRAMSGQPLGLGDHGHLHHLLMAFGHSHRRAVLVLLYWSAVLAFGSVAPAFVSVAALLPWLAVATIAGIAITALGVRARDLAPAGPAAAPAGAPAVDPAGAPAAGPAGAPAFDPAGAPAAGPAGAAATPVGDAVRAAPGSVPAAEARPLPRVGDNP
jgi:UDP-GlcNAc:undecaprenyl-phosphate/decaprenyl-phosphate GlcNAc-1-phosphate transferase